MPTTTITVKYVNQPKPGKKMGSIKTADGQIYGVWPDKLAGFQPNGSYEIEYDADRREDGSEWRKVKSIISANGVAAPMRRGGFAGGYRPTAPQDAERMFVCSILNAAIQKGEVPFETDEVINAVESLRIAWQQTFGRDAKQGEAA